MEKIIFKTISKSDNEIVFRYISLEDYKAMADYINMLSDEKTFITYQGEKIKYENEEKFVIGQIKNIENHKAVMILALHNDKIIGISGIDLKPRVENHVGVFGITIAKEFRGDGIGKLLMQLAIEEAIKNLTGLKIIILGVLANNPIAKSLYQKMGFIEYGNLPKGIKYRDEIVDHLEMYLNIEDYKHQ
jgi:RimJ/RimL family protein N-acetyltransferase